MDFLDILKTGLGLAGDIPGLGILKDAANLIHTATPEQKAAINTAMMAQQIQLKQLGIEEYKATQAESLAEIASDDKFTKRSRPFGVYCASVITAGIATALCFGIKIDPTVIGTLLLPLWGNAGFYTYNRTKEKMNGN